MARILAVFFIVAAAARAFYDWQLARMNDEPFSFLPIGQVWFNFDRNSLLGLQPGVERYLSPVIWENAIGPMLLWPMALVLLAIGLGFAGFAGWRARS
jgi:hypothetical protein